MNRPHNEDEDTDWRKDEFVDAGYRWLAGQLVCNRCRSTVGPYERQHVCPKVTS